MSFLVFVFILYIYTTNLQENRGAMQTTTVKNVFFGFCIYSVYLYY